MTSLYTKQTLSIKTLFFLQILRVTLLYFFTVTTKMVLSAPHFSLKRPWKMLIIFSHFLKNKNTVKKFFIPRSPANLQVSASGVSQARESRPLGSARRRIRGLPRIRCIPSGTRLDTRPRTVPNYRGSLARNGLVSHISGISDGSRLGLQAPPPDREGAPDRGPRLARVGARSGEGPPPPSPLARLLRPRLGLPAPPPGRKGVPDRGPRLARVRGLTGQGPLFVALWV